MAAHKRDSGLLTLLFNNFSDDNVMTLAAAVAYYTVFSLPAMLLIVIYAAGAVFGRAAVSGDIQARLSQFVGGAVAGVLQSAVQKASLSGGGGLATIFGIAGLLFSASQTFVQLQQSLNRIFRVQREESAVRSFAGKRLTSFLMIGGISILVFVSLLAGTAVSAASSMTGIPIPGWLMYSIDLAVSLVLFTVLFALIFKVMPDVEIDWRDVWVGAIVTSILFAIGKFLVSFYLAHTGAASIYGAAGSLALLLLWIYYSALIFFVGAEFVQAWTQHQGRSLRPEEGAVCVETTEMRR